VGNPENIVLLEKMKEKCSSKIKGEKRTNDSMQTPNEGEEQLENWNQ
jgi:hypothetical protein